MSHAKHAAATAPDVAGPVLVAASTTLEAEVERLRNKLRDAEATLDAIRAGAVDAVVVGHRTEEHEVLMLSKLRDDAFQTVRAIHEGEIDAVVVAAQPDHPEVVLLGSAGRRYRLLVEQLRDGAVTLTRDGDVAYANPAAASMLGVTGGTLLGARFAEFVEPRDQALLHALVDGRRGPATHAEVTMRAHGGATFQALLTPVATPDEPGVSLLISDLTDQRRLEEADETLRAVGAGKVDAFVVERRGGDEVQTLSDAHRPYRLMVEQMQQGAVTLSPRGEILYANRPFAAMLGQPPDALIGARLDGYVAPADRALLAALIAAPEGAAATGELTLVHGSGHSVPSLVAVAMLPEEGGVCLIVTDLSPQKAYENVLAAQAFERSILDQALDAIVILDADGRVIRASRAAFELCGSNPLLAPFRDHFALESGEGPLELAPVLGGTGTLRSREYLLRRRGAADATVLLSAGPLLDADDRPRGCVVTMSDITERRLTEDRLRESDRQKDEFLAILSHELRNPLAAITSAVEIVRATGAAASDPNLGYAIEIIRRQTSMLVRLIDDLLDLHRLGQGKVQLQMSVIDLRSVVELAIEIAKPALGAKEHELVTRFASDPLPVRGDSVRLCQVVANLLSNAAKYTEPRGRIELTLERNAEAPEAVVTVIDNGIGIASDMLARIFEPYQQVAASERAADTGLGLGLTVCRRLMQLHGGTVEAYSDGPGKGSRFVVRLGIANGSAASARTQPEQAAPRAGLRLLVVDDNRDAAEALLHLLRACGHEVEIAADGKTALACVERALPDAVLLDIGLPGMDGYEVARRLRAMPAAAAVTLVAMTGYGDAESRRRSHASGIDYHLTKPVDLATLQSILSAID